MTTESNRTRGPTHPVWVQRGEGLVLLVIALVGFSASGYSWWWFALLLLVPDVSMVGYLARPSLGAATYNIGHTLAGPALLLGWSRFNAPDVVLVFAWIWLAHIGFDRMLGYGLKYVDAFTHTHLGWIGPDRDGHA